MIVMTKIYSYPLPTLTLLMMYMNSCLIFMCPFAFLSYKYSVSTTIDSFGDIYPIPGMGLSAGGVCRHVATSACFQSSTFRVIYISHIHIITSLVGTLLMSIPTFIHTRFLRSFELTIGMTDLLSLLSTRYPISPIMIAKENRNLITCLIVRFQV